MLPRNGNKRCENSDDANVRIRKSLTINLKNVKKVIATGSTGKKSKTTTVFSHRFFDQKGSEVFFGQRKNLITCIEFGNKFTALYLADVDRPMELS